MCFLCTSNKLKINDTKKSLALTASVVSRHQYHQAVDTQWMRRPKSPPPVMLVQFLEALWFWRRGTEMIEFFPPACCGGFLTSRVL